MTDPRTDPRLDPRLRDPAATDPVLNSPAEAPPPNSRGMWGWIAGVAVLLLIGFMVVAGWNNNSNTARIDQPAPVTTSNAPARDVTPRSTTGSGATTAPQPAPAEATPAPAAPAPGATGQPSAPPAPSGNAQ